ncbi:DUF397 domain-containing protein [Actinomadura rubrisoli]|uniref:DUF397 domain-containing protein n=1 Tax=Actinomadura rubrisoli TaxID=2530368 RepID=A0A4R5C6N1_9ACTN|nr:DUF397 domain-containing protein [Actinomadura rubrisoli]TDD94349.1 DUF397 domain-containing protein [Actinomadura rubrisoli]
MSLNTSTWRKSSYSSSNGGACVEVADLGDVVGVRDSKEPDGPMLAVTRATFTTLTAKLLQQDASERWT